MCGICGIFNFDKNTELTNAILEKANNTLAHRGPDEAGVKIIGDTGLANRRLSIIDLSTGKQPISNEDKNLWIVFNGEIYNFLKLKRDLEKKGHRFKTKTDTEVILHLYEEEGTKAFNKLDGMFALAIWDRRRKKLILAKDPIGKKPLYWSICKNNFLFGSEVKSLFAFPDFKPTLDEESVAKYFFYGFIPSPQSIYKEVKKLPGGYFLEIDSKGLIKIKKYWDIDYSVKDTTSSFLEIKNEVVDLLKESVSKRLLADVPVGLFLSGGIDSGLVASMMVKFVDPKKIQAFTIGFKESEADESVYTKKTAAHLGIKLKTKIFSRGDLTKIIPQIVNILDEPFADPSILPTYLVSSLASENVKVVLSGDGGDESFAGYPKYLAHRLAESFLFKGLSLGKIVQIFPVLGQKEKTFFKYAQLPLYLRNELWITGISLVEIRKLLGRDVDLSDLEFLHQSFNGTDKIDESFYLDQKLTLSDLFLVKTDRASMAASLEIRCPFLDKRIINFCAKIPYDKKIKGWQTKAILREIAKDFLPKEIVNKRKTGFGIPLSKWLSSSFKPLLKEYLNIEGIKKEGLLDPSFVNQIIERGSSMAVWKLLVFEMWRKNWLKK